MPLTKALLEKLRCPESSQPLTLADDDVLEKIRACAGDATGFEGSLIREDGKRAYPIRGGFPILLLEEAIELD